MMLDERFVLAFDREGRFAARLGLDILAASFFLASLLPKALLQALALRGLHFGA
jgi:hypothetical protein